MSESAFKFVAYLPFPTTSVFLFVTIRMKKFVESEFL